MVLIVPDTFLVSIKGISGGQDVVNVVGIKFAGVSAEAVATAVRDAWIVSGGPITKLPNTYSMVEVKALSLDNANGQVFTLPHSQAGNLSGALATNGSCALVTYGNGTRSKSSKGRMYFGPLREVEINTDGRTLASASTFTTAMTAFKTDVETWGGQWVIVSRKNSTTAPITSITTQTVIATQRRRIR
jgi:hypothetical protein